MQVKLLKDIYDDGADHHPPCYIGRKGDIVNVKALYTIGVAHDGNNGEFTVHEDEFEVLDE